METIHNRARTPLALGVLTVILLVNLAMLMALQPASPASAAPPEPPEKDPADSGMSGFTGYNPRLEKPFMPENPTMADHGALTYWGVCMACHGDYGQGLTDEWRDQYGPEDRSCWQSKCHASNHPPQGFTFPHIVPPVAGEHALRKFVTAAELSNYIQATMPWWDPGQLTQVQADEITAYILRMNGNLPVGQEYTPKDASYMPVHLPIRQNTSERTGQLALAVLVGISALALVAVRRYTREDAPEAPARPNFFHHLHPPSIPMPQARWRYTLGAGGMAVFLALVLVITGTLEMFFYIPTPEQAGKSIQVITFMVPFGGLVRGIHFWAAQALVVVAAIHLARVVFTGAFSKPRRFNFLLGMILFTIILLMNFTGYVLRWDEGIRWALQVGTNLLATIPVIGDSVYGFIVGGPTTGLATLTRFYAWHIFGLTLVLVIFTGWHAFRVRRDGGISAPPPAQRENPQRISRFELVRREGLAILIALTVLIVVATLFQPPLSAPIQDASIGLQETRAPWFFLWVQQMLRYGDAFWMGIGIPLILLVFLFILPYIFPTIPEEQMGRWFPRAGRAAQIILAVLAVAWIALTLLERFR